MNAGSPTRTASRTKRSIRKNADWQTALEYVANGLSDVVAKHGAHAVGTLVSPHSTLEELALAGRFMRALGSGNIDFRLRQIDFRDAGKRAGIPWLGMPIAELNSLDRALIVGSFLRKDHPLLAQRLRQAAKKGAEISSLHSVDDDWLMRIAHRAIVPPSIFAATLAEIVVAVSQRTGKSAVAPLSNIVPTTAAEAIATSLLSGSKRAVLLGDVAVQHPDAAQIAALAQALCAMTGATLGVLTEAANTVGGYVANAMPQNGGLDAQAMLADPRRAYFLLHAEPEFDCANPVAARAALEKAELVVVMSPFKHGTAYADVLLPVAPFTETPGTFISCEGRAQSFHAVVYPRGETRPAWKVWRVLGTLMGFPGFDIDSSEVVRDGALGGAGSLEQRLSNAIRVEIAPPVTTPAPL